MFTPCKPASLALPAMCLAVAGAWAGPFGTVVSSTPVVASVPVAQRQCFDEPVYYQQPSSGAGAVLGAIAGAAIGNGLGSGPGRAAATGIGMVAGAAIGDRVEANSSPAVASTAQRCRNVTTYQNRTIGYDVVYDYQGVRRSARLAQDPGDRIELDVSVTPAGMPAPARVVEAPPTRVYGAPSAEVFDEPYRPPRVIYAPAPVVVAPWPYVVAGPGWYGGYGRWGGYGHHWR